MPKSRMINVAIMQLAITVLLALSIIGCNKQRDTLLSEDPVPSQQLKVPDLVEEEENIRCALYNPNNIYTTQMLQRQLQFDYARRIIDSCEQAGFYYSPENSFVTEYVAAKDSTYCTIIAMASKTELMTRVIYIGVQCNFVTCAKSADVVEYAFGSIPAQTGFEQLAENVWVKELDWGFTTEVGKIGQSMFFRKWLKCAAKAAFAGFIGTAAYCAVAGPAFGHCLAANALRTTVVSAVVCALSVLTD